MQAAASSCSSQQHQKRRHADATATNTSSKHQHTKVLSILRSSTLSATNTASRTAPPFVISVALFCRTSRWGDEQQQRRSKRARAYICDFLKLQTSLQKPLLVCFNACIPRRFPWRFPSHQTNSTAAGCSVLAEAAPLPI